jgi:hypothetical protein
LTWFWSCLCCRTGIEIWFNDGGLTANTFAPRYFADGTAEQILKKSTSLAPGPPTNIQVGEQFDISQNDETIAGLAIDVPFPAYHSLFVYPLVGQVPDIGTVVGVAPKLRYDPLFSENPIGEASDSTPYSNETVGILAVAAKPNGGYLIGQVHSFFQRTQGTIGSSAGGFTVGNQIFAMQVAIAQVTVGSEPTQQFSPTSPARTVGTYKIVLTDGSGNAFRTADLQWNANQAAVQAAIQACPGFGSATVATTGTSPNFTHTVTFTGLTGPLNLMTITNATTAADLNAAFPGETFVVTEITHGTTEVQQIAITQVDDPRTYKINWKDLNGQTYVTSVLRYDASAATVQAAIQAILPLATVTVTQSGSYPSATLTFTFPGFGGPMYGLAFTEIVNGTPYPNSNPPVFTLMSPAGGSNVEKWTITFTGNPVLVFSGYILIRATWNNPNQQTVTTAQIAASLQTSFATPLAAVTVPSGQVPWAPADVVTTVGTNPNYTTITHTITFTGFLGSIKSLHVVDMTGGLVATSPFQQKYELVDVPPSVDEVQQIAITGTPSSGTYHINWVHPSGAHLTTVPLNWNAGEGDVESALQGLFGIIAVTVVSTGTVPNYTHQITFRGFNGPLNLISITNSTNTGDFVVSRITAGVAAAAPSVVQTFDPFGQQDYDFFYNPTLLIPHQNPLIVMPWGPRSGSVYYGGFASTYCATNANGAFYWPHVPFIYTTVQTQIVTIATTDPDCTVDGTFTLSWTDASSHTFTIGPIDATADNAAANTALTASGVPLTNVSVAVTEAFASTNGYMPTGAQAGNGQPGQPGDNFGYSLTFNFTFTNLGLPVNPLIQTANSVTGATLTIMDPVSPASYPNELVLESDGSDGFLSGGTYTRGTEVTQYDQKPTGASSGSVYKTGSKFYAVWRFPGTGPITVDSTTTSGIIFSSRGQTTLPVPAPSTTAGNYWSIQPAGEFTEETNAWMWPDCMPLATKSGGFLAIGDALTNPTLAATGTWTLTLRDQTSTPFVASPLQWNATQQEVQDAIQALGGIFSVFTVASTTLQTPSISPVSGVGHVLIQTTQHVVTYIDQHGAFPAGSATSTMLGATVSVGAVTGGNTATQLLIVSFFGLTGPPSGSYRITLFDRLGNTGETDPLIYNADQATVQAAIQAVSGFSAVTVVTTSGVVGGSTVELNHTLSFVNMGGPIPAIQIAESTMNVGFFVNVINPGSFPQSIVTVTVQPLTIGQNSPFCVGSDGMLYVVGTDATKPAPPMQDIAMALFPTFGTYTVDWVNTLNQPVSTPPLHFNATQSDLQTALRAMTGLPNLVVITRGTSPNFSHRIVFYGLEGQTINAMTVVNSTAEIGATFAVSVATPGVDAIQRIAITGTPTSGTYTISWTDQQGNPHTTSTLNYNATQGDVQAALQAIPAMANFVVLTSGTSPNFTHTITFTNLGGPILHLMTVNNSTTGGTFTVSTLQPGSVEVQLITISGDCQNMGGPYPTQSLTVSGTPTAGTYTITVTDASSNSFTTTPLGFSAVAAQVQSAIQALGVAFIGTQVSSSGTSPNFVHTITFVNVPGPLPVISVTSGTTGGTFTPAILHQGSAKLGYTIQWVDKSGVSHTTSILLYNATAAQIQTALRAFPGMGSITVTNSFSFVNQGNNVTLANGEITVNFIGVGTGISLLQFQGYPIQTLTVTGTPTAGTYTISLVDPNGNTQTTGQLAYNADGPTVQSALAVLPGLEEVTVSTAGTSPNFTHTITFANLPGPLNLMMIDHSGVTGGSFVAAISQQGVTGQGFLSVAPTRFPLGAPTGILKIDDDFNVQWAGFATAAESVLIRPGDSQVYAIYNGTSVSPIAQNGTLVADVFDAQTGILQQVALEISNLYSVGAAPQFLPALTPDGRVAIAG